jgi:hypothetical protein
MRSVSRSRAAAALLLSAFLWAAQSPALAQKKSQDPNIRSVEGIVTDPAGAPVPGAVVYLKNTKTLQVRTFNAKEDGSYIFHGLSTTTEYELKAENKGATSDLRNLSEFDSRQKAVINLKLKK